MRRIPRKSTPEKIGVQAAYTVWRSLVDRYVFIEHFNKLKNYTHDRDFLFLLTNLINDFKEEANRLEELCQNFYIQSPQPSSRDTTATGHSEVLSDRDTAEVVYRFLRLDLNILLLGLKNSHTNDSVKEFAINLVNKAINRVDKFIKYIKFKDWLEIPPLYPNVNPEVREQLAVNKVYLLYDHLIFRYNNIHQTRIFSSFVSDTDFKALLDVGTRVLEKQVKTLEEKLLYYGITLPKPYPFNTPVPENKQALQDRFMYNTIFRGIQDAVVLHGTAISEIIVNDGLRKMFIELTLDELSMMDKMDKYGKLKGWVFVVPSFKGGT